jgi:predicted RNase H-like HicB family nuclease
MARLDCRIEYHEEDGKVIAYAPDLDMSGMGDDKDVAGDILKEALDLFILGCQEEDSLQALMAECGFEETSPGVWQPTGR